MSVKKRRYSKEFKQDAVNLANSIGVTKAATELGISAVNIGKWKRLLSPEKSHFNNNELEKENRRLKKELMYMKKINEVLKKSTAILSQEQFTNFK